MAVQFYSLMERIERLLPMDALLTESDDLFEKSSLKLAQLKFNGKYSHLDSSSFKKVPAYFHEQDGVLVKNEDHEFLVAEDLEDGNDSAEEMAREEVDRLVGPKHYSSIEEMIADNEKRSEMVKLMIEKFRNEKPLEKTQFAYRDYSFKDAQLPDVSQMFNILSATNKELQAIQSSYKNYLDSLVKRAVLLRKILASKN